jgi:hypothetical protein
MAELSTICEVRHKAAPGERNILACEEPLRDLAALGEVIRAMGDEDGNEICRESVGRIGMMVTRLANECFRNLWPEG